MKKFITDIRTLAALLIASATFVACSSDNDSIIDNQQPVNPTGKYTMTIQASKGDGATTRALNLTDHTLNATWSEGEIVEVYQGGSKIGELTAAASTDASTTLTGTFDAAPSTSADLTFYFHTNTTSYSGQDGTLATIASSYDFCAPATVATGDFTVNSANHTISVPAGISFGANQQAIIKFTLKDNTNDAAISPSALTVTDGTSTVELTSIPAATYTANGGDNNVLYVAFPAAGSAKTITLTATVGDDTYTYETATAKTFVNGQYYEITVKMTKQAPAGPTYPVALNAVTTSDYVGSVIASDGYVYAKASDATAAGNTAVAIIAYVGSAGSVDDSSDSYKGLAIAMSDCGSDWMHWTEKGYGSYVSCSDDLGTALSYKDGIGSTSTLASHTAASAAASNNSTAAPMGTSGWFLPSMGQWNLILQGLATKKQGTAVTTNISYGGTFDHYTATNLNSVITAAGGTEFESNDYWSSTQYGEEEAWSVQLGEDGGSAWECSFDGNCYVRSALAF